MRHQNRELRREAFRRLASLRSPSRVFGIRASRLTLRQSRMIPNQSLRLPRDLLLHIQSLHRPPIPHAPRSLWKYGGSYPDLLRRAAGIRITRRTRDAPRPQVHPIPVDAEYPHDAGTLGRQVFPERRLSALSGKTGDALADVQDLFPGRCGDTVRTKECR